MAMAASSTLLMQQIFTRGVRVDFTKAFAKYSDVEAERGFYF